MCTVRDGLGHIYLQEETSLFIFKIGPCSMTPFFFFFFFPSGTHAPPAATSSNRNGPSASFLSVCLSTRRRRPISSSTLKCFYYLFFFCNDAAAAASFIHLYQNKRPTLHASDAVPPKLQITKTAETNQQTASLMFELAMRAPHACIHLFNHP